MRILTALVASALALAPALAEGHETTESARIEEIQVHHPASTGFTMSTREEGGLRRVVITRGVEFHYEWSVFDVQPEIDIINTDSTSTLRIRIARSSDTFQAKRVACCTSCSPIPHYLPADPSKAYCFAGGGGCQYCTTSCPSGGYDHCDQPGPTDPQPEGKSGRDIPIEDTRATREVVGNTLHINRDLRQIYDRLER